MSLEDRRIKLDLLHGFGSSTSQGFRDCTGIIDDQGTKKIMYPISKYIGIKQIEQPDMSFLKLSDNLEKIHCMTISQNKKFVAVCEQTKDDQEEGKKKFPSVSVYDIKSAIQKSQTGNEKKYFPYADSTVENFSALSFSNDAHSRFLLCLTEAPEHKLVFIDVLGSKKNYASCVINQTIDRITISPFETHLVAISGPNCFKILRVQESSFVYMAESIKKLDQKQNFTDHCWFEENRVALANDKGEIYTIYNNEVEQYINCGLNSPNLKITTIKQFSKGFIAAGENGNFSLWIKDENPMKIYDRRQDDDKYDLVQLKCWRSERAEEVTCIDITSNDDLMAVAFKNNDIATYDIQKIIPAVIESIDVMKRNLVNLESRVKFQYVFSGSHQGPITSMDICLQRPLIATCSNYDSTIRIWNYINYRCELIRKFVTDENLESQKPLLSIAFHPSGYYLAAGFTDKLRIFHVLHDNLRKYQEIQLKNATYLKFSNGGQYLAAAAPKQQAQKTSQYQISVYNAYTSELIVDLKGPTNKVTQLLWTPKDDILSSCSLDGLAYEWNTTKWVKKDRNILKKQSHLTTIMYNEVVGLTAVAGGEENKGLIQEYKYKGDDTTDDYSDFMELNHYRITKLHFLRSYFNYTGIIGGTQAGQIKVWSHNLGINSGMPFETISVHDGEVTNIRISPNGRFVFTTGQEGIIFIFQVTELSQNGEVVTAKNNQKQIENQIPEQINPKSLCVDDMLADVIMVQKQDMDYYIQERNKIKITLEDLKQRKLEEMEDFQKKQDKMLKELEEQKEKEQKKLLNDILKLQTSKDILQKESQHAIDTIEQTHSEQVRELDKLFEAKLAYENEKYMQQEQELQEAKQNFTKQIKEIEKKNDKTLMLLKSEFIEQFSKVNKVYTNTKDTSIDIKKTYEERLSQLEEEHELEINVMMNKYQQIEKQKNDVISEKKKQITSLEEDKKKNTQEKEELTKKVQEKGELVVELQKQVETLQRELNQEKKEKKNKEDIVKDKDKSINNLKYKISDLQKTKHVLSFRTTEMRKSLEPKEAQIEKLKEELFKLEHEFQSILKNYQMQNDKMKKLENQIETLNQNLKTEQNNKKQVENLHNKMIMDIYNTVKKNDLNEYINGMKYLYHEYVEHLSIHNGKQDPKSVEEMGRMIGQLEKSIFQINKSTGKVITRREKEIHKKTKENAELIYDLNDIRKENKEQKAEISNLRIQKETATKEKKAFIDEIQKLTKSLNKQKKLGNTQSLSANYQNENEQSPDIFSAMGNMGSNLDQYQSSKPHLNQKGKIVKGSNFDLKTLGTFDKAKMMDLMAEVELITQKRMIAEEELQNIKRKIRSHLHQYGCGDKDLQQECLIGLGGDDLEDDIQGGIKLPQIPNYNN